MKKMFVATRNEHKLREIRQILAGQDFNVHGVKDFSDFVFPEETGNTFMENARIKALALSDYLKKSSDRQLATSDYFILADDSGLECEDLGGLPGVQSARFAGENATDDQNNQKLIHLFQQQTHLSRAIQYVCAMILILPDGKEIEIEETCQGHIVFVPKGKNGFGYDPYFYLESYDKTMAELSPDEKNKISHRGKALRLLVKELKGI